MDVLRATRGLSRELWLTDSAIFLVDIFRPRMLITYILFVMLCGYFAAGWMVLFGQLVLDPVSSIAIYLGCVMTIAYLVLRLLIRHTRHNLTSIPLEGLGISNQIAWEKVSSVVFEGRRMKIQLHDGVWYDARVESDVDSVKSLAQSKVGQRLVIR